MKINLIPEEKQKKTRVKTTNYVVTFILVALGIGLTATILVLGVVYSTKKIESKRLDGEITDYKTKLKEYEDLEKNVAVLETRLSDIKEILEKNPEWSKFYVEIEKAIPNDIKIISLDFEDDDGKFNFKGEGNGLSSVARFVKSLEDYRLVTLSGNMRPDTKMNLNIVKIDDPGVKIQKEISSDKDGNIKENFGKNFASGTYRIETTFTKDEKEGPKEVTETVAEFTINDDLDIKSFELKSSDNLKIFEINSLDATIDVLFEDIKLSSVNPGERGRVSFSAVFNLKSGVLW